MKIKNPNVTLADEARTTTVENVKNGFLDWLFQFSVTGDDGELYALGGSILSLAFEHLDVVSINWTSGKGNTRQLPNSIYKVAEYPVIKLRKIIQNPEGTLEITEEADHITVTCGKEYRVDCYADHSWHFQIDTCDGQYKADLYHYPHGFPLWYGRETPSYLTQHSITYGYNWAGDVEGTIEIEGRKVAVKGQGIRERYVAVDSCATELGGWEDWGWFAFDEIHSSLYDMKLGMKDFSLYHLPTRQYYPEGEMTIEHEDWAFFRELDGFIPTVYQVTIKVSAGIYTVRAHVCNAHTWGVTFQVPDYPVATLIFDKVDGRFTRDDGTIEHLSSGRGTMSIRQWHAYPNILPRELYTDETKIGKKLQTL